MRKVLPLAATAVLGAAAFVYWPRTHRAHPRPPHGLADDRRKAPGIHRASPAELAVLDRESKSESAKIFARKRLLAASVPATTWVNLGPTGADAEYNYYRIDSVDSGRPNAIVVDPRDPQVVYDAVSGGGIWKTYDLDAAGGAHWAPTTDLQPNLAIGALAIDVDHPDTLYAGAGDFVDGSGDTIQKTTDGGSTWGTPVELPGVSGFRQITVHGDVVLAATDIGLYRSSDAGATFTQVNLPDVGGAPLAESVWSVVRTGDSSWVAAGVTACDPGSPPPYIYYDSDVGQNGCTYGNNNEIWTSADDGASWTVATTTPPRAGTGRTTLAAAGSTVYAYVGSYDGGATLGFWRSSDGGATWVDATGTLANPTLYDQNGDDSCLDTNIGNDQSWYNQAIVVDPTNPDHVLVGGNLCGMRTLNGTAPSPTWELVSHWLPGPGYGETANGRLPYVHADWHTITSIAEGGRVRTFAGTDGGIFSSENLFTSAQPEAVRWTQHNNNLTTHLFYTVASGDPADGDGFVAFGGLQDNGTRFRADPAQPGVFNQPVGADGIGSVVHHSTSGTTYYASTEYGGRAFCQPAQSDCSVDVDYSDPSAIPHWQGIASLIPQSMDDEAVEERQRAREKASGQDQEPFMMHYADVPTDTAGQSVLTHSDEQVFVTAPSVDGMQLVAISQDLTGDPNGGGFSNVVASRSTPGLYGGVGFAPGVPFYLTTQGNTPATWTGTQPVSPDGVNWMLYPSSMDFPPGGNGQTFIGAFTGPMTDAAQSPPPDDKGHLYRTTDGGQTWTSIVGSDPAHRLPNVPVNVVKYDPITATTIYAGTSLGMYFTTDDGATWNRMGDDFPMIPVTDIYVAKNQDFIRVSTYGRGLWEIYPSAGANHGAPGNGDYDRNLRLDWVDLGAMSARLGETPSTTTAPLYSWILDITSAAAGVPMQVIDDDDLTALLARFGGHP